MTTLARKTALHLTPEEFKSLGHKLVDQVAASLAAIAEGPVTPGESPAEVRAALGLGRALPEDGTAPDALLTRTAEGLFAHSLFNGHPRFLGYITSSPAPIAILAEMLAAAVNPNCGAFVLSPAATEIEREAVRWIAQFMGYPAECGGVLVSGGNMANMVAFWAARAAASSDVREKGVAASAPLRAYASSETHTWLQKAADLAGLGTDAVRWIPCDDAQCIDLAALRAAVAADRAAGAKPFLVVGTGGSVMTGSVDDLEALAAFCREEQLWFHVDGAYGGFAALAPGAPPALAALKLADSVAVDPHKWLYMPLEAGCTLVRDPEKLRAAFAYHPPYYHLEEELTNFVDYGPQNSRGFRALKVWLAFQHAGAAGYRAAIGEDIALAVALAEGVAAHPELEAGTQSLSITTFRYVPADLRARAAEPAVAEYLEALNRELLDASQKRGDVFVSNAIVRGRYLLRACIVNLHTSAADIAAIPEQIARHGKAIDQTMRPAALR